MTAMWEGTGGRTCTTQEMIQCLLFESRLGLIAIVFLQTLRPTITKSKKEKNVGKK